MTIHEGSARGKLLNRFGAFADPSRFASMLSSLERVVRLPHVYRVRTGLPGEFSPDQRQALLAAWDETSFLLHTAIMHVWDRAFSGDDSVPASHPPSRLLLEAIEVLEPYETLLAQADLGMRLVRFDPRAFDLLEQYGSAWVALVREAILPGTDMHAVLSSVPAWSDACHKRRTDAKWASRQLKRLRERLEAHLAWIFGKVDKSSRWASPHARDMMEREVHWSREWQDGHFMARPEDGFIMPMKELVEQSVKMRRSEDYALAIGLQSLAERHRLHFVMVTVTLPGEWSPRRGPRSSVYNGASPQEANRELKSMMKRIRTNLLDGSGVCIGFCVTEPQETGVPHCHVMILTDDPARVERIVLSYKQSPVHQIDVRRWHLAPEEGKAASIASYLTKYLMKGKDLDKSTPDALALAAWRRGAACRTTSWFGLGKGFKGRWRVVFRAELTGEADTIRSKTFQKVRDCMHNKNWGLALSLVADLSAGGLVSPVDTVPWQPIREKVLNRYDEWVERVTGFLLETGESVMFSTGDWELCEVLDDDEGLDPGYDPPDASSSQPGVPPDPEIDFLLDAWCY